MFSQRHILTEKKGIPLSVILSSVASTDDVNLVTDVVDNTVIKRPKSLFRSKPKSRRQRRRRLLQHLCLDKGYKSTEEEQELIKRGGISYIYQSKRRKRRKEEKMVKK